MTRTFFDRRVACKKIMRLAHVLLDVSAHERPGLTCEERKADLALELPGREQQSDFHPPPDLVEQLLVRLEASDSLEVSELLPITSFVRHHDLRARAALVHRDAPSLGEQLEPAYRDRVAHRADVKAQLHQGAIRHIVAEQRLETFSDRPLTIIGLHVDALLVGERLRQDPSVAVDGGYPDVPQRS